MNFDFVVEPLGKKHQRQNFDCGEESLNLFLKNYARQNSERGLGKTFVAVLPGKTGVCGYYCHREAFRLRVFLKNSLATQYRSCILAALRSIRISMDGDSANSYCWMHSAELC